MPMLRIQRIQALLSRFDGLVYEPIGVHYTSSTTGRGVASIGSGDDFHSFRPYRDGDDVRMVDWTAFARSRELWSRQFTSNRTKKLVLGIDGSTSMHGEKWSQAVTVSLLLSALCHQGGHEVRLLVFGDNQLLEVPQRFENDIDRVAFDWLSQYRCTSRTSLDAFLGQQHRWDGAELTLLSDFMWETVYGELESLRTLTVSPISLIRFSSPHDYAVPEGAYLDPETADTGQIAASAVSEAQDLLDAFRAQLFSWSKHTGGLCFDWTSTNDEQELARWLTQRGSQVVADGMR